MDALCWAMRKSKSASQTKPRRDRTDLRERQRHVTREERALPFDAQRCAVCQRGFRLRSRPHRSLTWSNARCRWTATILQFISGQQTLLNEELHFVAGTEGANREISILLGNNIKAGRLVAGITRSLPDNWTIWPPHEHAAMLEEVN
jgi:hypothetical protein